ncbi:MAG: PucR family transcriptional regulator [Pseudonocardiaceae bacterium]
MNVTRLPVRSPHLGEHEWDLHHFCALPMMMSEGRSEEHVLELAKGALSACGSWHIEAAYLKENDRLMPFPINGQRTDRDLEVQVEMLRGGEGAVTLSGRRWGWAFALRGLGRQFGYLVIAAPTEPSDDEFFLVKLLAQQTAAALLTTSLHRKEREQARQLRMARKEQRAANKQLEVAVSDLERQTTIHNVFTCVSASGEGEEGIAKALHQLTGLAVAVEDRFGNLRASAGPGPSASGYPKPDPNLREELLGRVARRGHPMRDGDRLIALAQPRNEILGVLALIDPARTVGRHEVFALVHGATVLALELAYQRKLAEMELRLRRDLVDDLITGTDQGNAFARAEAVGHDLRAPHYIAVVQWQDTANDETFAEAIARAARATGMRSLLARLYGVVVLLISGEPPGRALYEEVSREVGTTTGAIGISGRCESLADLPQSFHKALRALHIRQKSSFPDGVCTFGELGIYRILGAEDGETELFVQEWLGALLDYDNRHRANLVRTLSEYLECGGNYSHTAQVLVIHRSTLRYRLQRIREVTGLSLQDPDSRLNLHVATRAWKVLSGEVQSESFAGVRWPRGR